MITFFDLPSKTPTNAWSPNTWKIRFCLNYKGLPYKTEWVEMADIPALYHKYNTPACARPDGSPEPYYCLPAILDVNPATGEEVMIADSIKIARYLDETYPETPKVLPVYDDASLKEQETFAYKALLSMVPIYPNIFIAKPQMGSPESHARICNIRAGLLRKRFGPKYENIISLDEVTLSDEDRTESIHKLRESLENVGGAITDDGGDGKVTWCFGDAISFADFALASALIWVRVVLGEESEEWKAVIEWDGGKWKRFMARLEAYQAVL
ncbi:hypothetical protein BKA70DRAFT_1154146 [Coprinopsis sp. MPI-PUGE-AT-0042]|nr:hypothetical protein BKA70DRAFT_1154146 [Coprinopsis sp. MPI-PUGE-AT-0042]